MGNIAHLRNSSYAQSYDYTITLIESTQECSVPSFIEIGSVVLRTRFFNFVNKVSLIHNYLPFKQGMAFYSKEDFQILSRYFLALLYIISTW